MNLGNATKENLAIGCLHSIGGYWISNEGTKLNPNYHVWVPNITHCDCDSSYSDLSCAVSRCNYLAKNKITIPYPQPKICGQDCGCEDSTQCKF